MGERNLAWEGGTQQAAHRAKSWVLVQLSYCQFMLNTVKSGLAGIHSTSHLSSQSVYLQEEPNTRERLFLCRASVIDSRPEGKSGGRLFMDGVVLSDW